MGGSISEGLREATEGLREATEGRLHGQKLLTRHTRNHKIAKARSKGRVPNFMQSG